MTRFTDPEAKAIVAKYKRYTDKVLGKVIGRSKITLYHQFGDTGVTSLGYLVSSAFQHETNADIGMVNGGGIRQDLKAGTITLADIYGVVPFDNVVMVMDIKGRNLKSILEHGVSNQNYGGLQFSGLKVSYNPLKPKGERIVAITLANGKRLEMDNWYKVATVDYVLHGGDQYAFSKVKNLVSTGFYEREIVAKYVHKLGTIRAKDIKIGLNIITN